MRVPSSEKRGKKVTAYVTDEIKEAIAMERRKREDFPTESDVVYAILKEWLLNRGVLQSGMRGVGDVPSKREESQSPEVRQESHAGQATKKGHKAPR